MTRLSVVIVTYNYEGDIYDCIGSIYEYADIPKEELEVIIVDNCSQDGEGMLRRLRERFGDSLVLISNDKNGGYGQGNNVGIRHASAPIIMVMTPDVRLIEPVMQTALRAFENSDKLSIYGMKMMQTPTKPSTNSFACTYMMNGYLFTLLSSLGNKLDWFMPRWMYISGACFFLRKSMFEQIGMYDESVFLYGEEDDIHYRLRKAFGPYFKYNKHLHYLHLTMGREPSFNYEKTKVDVAVDHAERKGYPRKRMLNNRLQNTNLLLLRERIVGGRSKSYEVLNQLRDYIKGQREKASRKVFYIDPMSMKNLSVYDHNLLSNMKGDITYFCSKHYDYKPLENVRMVKAFAYNYISNIYLKAASYIMSYLRIALLTITKRPQVVHVQWCKIPKWDLRYLRFAKRVAGSKIIITAHNILPHNTGEKYKHVFSDIYNTADVIIVHTQRTKGEMIDMFGIEEGKIHVMRHGIVSIAEEEPTSSLPDFNGKFVIASLGEQSQYKGIDLLAEAWAITPELREDEDLRLLIAGKVKGLDLSNIEGIENVYIRDEKLPNGDFIALLRLVNVYVLPYRKISQSGALMTAMAENIPVAVTDVGGLTEPLQFGKIGWVIPACTMEAVREALLHIVANKDEALRIKSDHATWDCVKAHYQWSAISQQLQHLYNSI